MSALHCYFCGGKECKYENWKLWAPLNAIDGIYSNWITNQILAMQRPSTRLLKEYKLIEHFEEINLRAIFNLQIPGEHLSCGDGVETSSGFSYLPENFIDNGIMFYNFGWTDMDTPDLNLMLNIVNVMASALEKEKKIAVHCHAGLGRTGLTIACYLVYAENIPADAAILIVRGKRPGSVQTKKQTQFVLNFEKLLKNLQVIFPSIADKSLKVQLDLKPLNFREYIFNQRKFIKNPEFRYLRYIPKIIHVVMTRVLSLCADSEENWDKALETFLQFQGADPSDSKLQSLQKEINHGEWNFVKAETNVEILIELMLYWILLLKDPLVSDATLRKICDKSLEWDAKLVEVGREVFESLNLILRFFREIPSVSKSTLDRVFQSFATYFTSHRQELPLYIDYSPPSKVAPAQSGWLFKSLRTAAADTVSKAADSVSNITPADMMQSVKNQAEVVVNVANMTANAAAMSASAAAMTAATTITTAVSNAAIGISKSSPARENIPVSQPNSATSSPNTVPEVEVKVIRHDVPPPLPAPSVPEIQNETETPKMKEMPEVTPAQKSLQQREAMSVTEPQNRDLKSESPHSPEKKAENLERLIKADSIIMAPECAPTEGLINFLNYVYKTYTTTPNNTPITVPQHGSLGPPAVLQVYRTPSEVLLALPKESKADNLALLFQSNKPLEEKKIKTVSSSPDLSIGAKVAEDVAVENEGPVSTALVSIEPPNEKLLLVAGQVDTRQRSFSTSFVPKKVETEKVAGLASNLETATPLEGPKEILPSIT